MTTPPLPQTLRRPAPGAPAPLPEWVARVYRFERPLTPDEFVEIDLPKGEGKRELVDGEVLEMPGVGPRHGEVAGALYALLRDHVRANGGRALGRALPEACYRLALPDGSAPVRCPDVSFVDAGTLARLGIGPAAHLPKTYLATPPPLACEVLSDHDRKNPTDFRRKLEDYRSGGVRLVWVIDPDEETVTVEDHLAGTGAVLGRGDVLGGGAALPGLTILLDDLFEG